MFRECQWWKQLLLNVASSVIFYTSLPLPYLDKLDFQGVARFVTLVGLIIGGILAVFDTLMDILGVPIFTRSAIIIGGWVLITGGLHLDGAMDTADGLAVTEPQKRLEVMADSVTGAFGAMAAIAILLLKTAALTDIPNHRWLVLIAACAWGRWGQLWAIARYPYLKPTGKGAFHKQVIQNYKDWFPGLFLVIGATCLGILLGKNYFHTTIIMLLAGSMTSFLVGAWFTHKLGGHTGDTYGAVVEWTEAIFLCVMTMIF
ncbi:adenosylcobinamide-GDP ribazoletransferase [Calothrix sp. 336/3]|uniref:adenosylcobinamide-GDP ribazoletransferase n=1 Tax=Calothrix sp. 336/3 TaxID=1337936 RepID=UPI0004E39158|nr:adenosylcobinamide-GDP ribazoletransferase [Calothrix sp. 336/3]AKG23178.1 cobalamin synthase [Calothrix sp. 336/3]